MDDDTTEPIKGAELKAVVCETTTFNGKIVGFKKRYPGSIGKEPKVRGRIMSGGDWLIQSEAVQIMLDKNILTLKPEPPEGSRLPSPEAFLKKHDLNRPDK